MNKKGKGGKKLAEGEELGVAWETFADGMPHRLKRKRDFPDVDPKTATQAVTNAAKRMDKAVQVVPDKGRHKSSFLWVQFADYTLAVGDPCKCGGRQILRFHQYFGRCAACNAQIIFASPDTDATQSIDEDRYGRDEAKYGWA